LSACTRNLYEPPPTRPVTIADVEPAATDTEFAGVAPPTSAVTRYDSTGGVKAAGALHDTVASFAPAVALGLPGAPERLHPDAANWALNCEPVSADGNTATSARSPATPLFDEGLPPTTNPASEATVSSARRTAGCRWRLPST
jgi:hypothetical protein